MSIDEVIRRMGRGDVVQHIVVVPEGLTAEETFRLFLDQGIGTPEAFGAALADTPRSCRGSRRARRTSRGSSSPTRTA